MDLSLVWTRQRPNGSDAPRVIVFVDGVMDTKTRPGSVITEALMQYGDVDLLTVNYPQPLRVKEVVAAICSAVRCYRRVTLIGVSMGGLVGCDVIQELKVQGYDPDNIDWIAADTPFDRHDLTNPWAWLVAYLPPIRTPKWLDRKIMGGDRKEPPHDENMGTTAETEWRLHLGRIWKFPVGEFLRQSKYIVRRHPSTCQNWLGVRAAFIKSKHDDTVKATAAKRWEAIYWRLRMPIIELNNEAHADVLEFPYEWAHGLIKALEAVDATPKLLRR